MPNNETVKPFSHQFLKESDLAAVADGQRILDELPQYAVQLWIVSQITQLMMAKRNPINRYQQLGLFMHAVLTEYPLAGAGDLTRTFDMEESDIREMTQREIRDDVREHYKTLSERARFDPRFSIAAAIRDLEIIKPPQLILDSRNPQDVPADEILQVFPEASYFVRAVDSDEFNKAWIDVGHTMAPDYRIRLLVYMATQTHPQQLALSTICAAYGISREDGLTVLKISRIPVFDDLKRALAIAKRLEREQALRDTRNQLISQDGGSSSRRTSDKTDYRFHAALEIRFEEKPKSSYAELAALIARDIGQPVKPQKVADALFRKRRNQNPAFAKKRPPIEVRLEQIRQALETIGHATFRRDSARKIAQLTGIPTKSVRNYLDRLKEEKNQTPDQF